MFIDQWGAYYGLFVIRLCVLGSRLLCRVYLDCYPIPSLYLVMRVTSCDVDFGAKSSRIQLSQIRNFPILL